MAAPQNTVGSRKPTTFLVLPKSHTTNSVTNCTEKPSVKQCDGLNGYAITGLPETDKDTHINNTTTRKSWLRNNFPSPIISVVLVSSAVIGTSYYDQNLSSYGIEQKISTAIERHNDRHRHDAIAVRDVFAVDIIKHCIGSTLRQTNFISKHGLNYASGDDIVSEVEKDCLRRLFAQTAAAEAIALERWKTDGDDFSDQWFRHHINTLRPIYKFYKSRGYSLPDELQRTGPSTTTSNEFNQLLDGGYVGDPDMTSWK